jgi:hypothetical protein
MLAVKRNAVTEFVDAAISHQDPEITLCLEKLEAMEQLLTRALLAKGQNTQQVTQQLFTRWKASCPDCSKSFQTETLNYLATFYNMRGGSGFQCPECGHVLKDVKIRWIDASLN